MELTVPGDKSISQRALILAGLATGRSRLRGISLGADPLATADVLRVLGVRIPTDGGDDAVVVEGRGLRGLDLGGRTLDCRNSGTCARLLLGVLAGQHGTAVLTGDASLRGRPMARVTDPLRQMGARIAPTDKPGRLPLQVEGAELRGLDHRTAVASAQVKSALLLAGLVSGQSVSVTELGRSRDHTERMLSDLGLTLNEQMSLDGVWRVELTDPPPEIPPLDLGVPGDFSSAAFLLVFALLGGAGPDLTVRRCGLNPTRTGLLGVLRRMGADIEWSAFTGGGDPRGDLTARPSQMVGTEVRGDEIPALLDEIPILAIAAALCDGVTRITGAQELRVKETDRIRAMVDNLREVGVQVEEFDDGLEIVGSDAPLSGRIRTFGDHRIAMAFGVLDALPDHDVEIDDLSVTDISFPGFWSLLDQARRR